MKESMEANNENIARNVETSSKLAISQERMKFAPDYEYFRKSKHELQRGLQNRSISNLRTKMGKNFRNKM